MKLLLIIVGGLLALVAIVVIIGALLPKRHEASVTVKFGKTAEEVWAVVTDFAAAASWRSDVKSMQQLPDQNGNAVWREETKQGPITYEIVVSEPPKRLVMRIADDKLPFGGTWTYVIATGEGRARLKITEDGEVYNPIFRFMARFVFGHRATLERYVKDLGQKLGEEVSFDASAT